MSDENEAQENGPAVLPDTLVEALLVETEDAQGLRPQMQERVALVIVDQAENTPQTLSVERFLPDEDEPLVINSWNLKANWQELPEDEWCFTDTNRNRRNRLAKVGKKIGHIVDHHLQVVDASSWPKNCPAVDEELESLKKDGASKERLQEATESLYSVNRDKYIKINGTVLEAHGIPPDSEFKGKYDGRDVIYQGQLLFKVEPLWVYNDKLSTGTNKTYKSRAKKKRFGEIEELLRECVKGDPENGHSVPAKKTPRAPTKPTAAKTATAKRAKKSKKTSKAAAAKGPPKAVAKLAFAETKAAPKAAETSDVGNDGDKKMAAAPKKRLSKTLVVEDGGEQKLPAPSKTTVARPTSPSSAAGSVLEEEHEVDALEDAPVEVEFDGAFENPASAPAGATDSTAAAGEKPPPPAAQRAETAAIMPTADVNYATKEDFEESLGLQEKHQERMNGMKTHQVKASECIAAAVVQQAAMKTQVDGLHAKFDAIDALDALSVKSAKAHNQKMAQLDQLVETVDRLKAEAAEAKAKHVELKEELLKSNRKQLELESKIQQLESVVMKMHDKIAHLEERGAGPDSASSTTDNLNPASSDEPIMPALAINAEGENPAPPVGQSADTAAMRAADVNYATTKELQVTKEELREKLHQGFNGWIGFHKKKYDRLTAIEEQHTKANRAASVAEARQSAALATLGAQYEKCVNAHNESNSEILEVRQHVRRLDNKVVEAMTEAVEAKAEAARANAKVEEIQVEFEDKFEQKDKETAGLKEDLLKSNRKQSELESEMKTSNEKLDSVVMNLNGIMARGPDSASSTNDNLKSSDHHKVATEDKSSKVDEVDSVVGEGEVDSETDSSVSDEQNDVEPTDSTNQSVAEAKPESDDELLMLREALLEITDEDIGRAEQAVSAASIQPVGVTAARLVAVVKHSGGCFSAF